jgi:hypothetical protein
MEVTLLPMRMEPRRARIRLPLAWLALLIATASCDRSASTASHRVGPGPVQSLGAIELVARLVEIPDGAIFQRDLYDYATVLKYEVISVQRGPLEPGMTILVGHYNPWKPRAEAADARVRNIGGGLRQYRAGQRHHLALEASMEDHFMGGVVNKYFESHAGPIFWAVWTDHAD